MVSGKQPCQSTVNYEEIRTLSIHIDSARNFDTEEELVGCSNTPGIFFQCCFNGDILRSRIITFPTRAGKHRLIWKDTLQWQFRKKQLAILKRSGHSIKLKATLVKDWNPKDKNPEKYFKDGNFHTELGFVVFPIKTAESHAKIPDGPPLDWYRIRHVPSWFKLGPSVKLQMCIQEDELWTPEMIENKQKEKEKKKKTTAIKKGVAKNVNNNLKQEKQNIEEKKEKIINIHITNQKEAEGNQNPNVNTNQPKQNAKEIRGEQEEEIEKNEIEASDEYSCDSFGNSENGEIQFEGDQEIDFNLENMKENDLIKLTPTTKTKEKNNEIKSDSGRKSIEIRIPIIGLLQNQNEKEFEIKNSGEKNFHKKILIHNEAHSIPELALPQSISRINTPPVNTPRIGPQKHEILASHYIKNPPRILPSRVQGNGFSAPHSVIDNLNFYNTNQNGVKNNHNNQNNTSSTSTSNCATKHLSHLPPSSVGKQQQQQHNLSSSSNFPPTGPLHETSHEYRICIEIKSVKNMLEKNTIYFKYLYPLFGCITPFQTNLIEINEENLETTISKGYCNFHFHMKPSRLHASFHKKPLLIQCFVRNETGDREQGLCLVDLEQMLQNSNYKSNHSQGSQCGVFDSWLPILDEDGFQGETRICIKIENLGINSRAQVSNGVYEDALSFHSLWEIELWKKKQKRKFEERWKSFENEEIENLKTSHNMKEKKLEEKYEKKHEKLLRLEKKLKSSLFEIEKQEKTLKLEELRISKVRENLEHEFKLKQEDVISTIKRMKLDKIHEIELVKKQNGHLLQENEKYRKQLMKQELEYEEMKRELLQEKHKKENSTMGQLKLNNKNLKQEIANLELQIQQSKHNEQDLKNQLISSRTEIQELKIALTEKEKQIIAEEKERLKQLRLNLLHKQQQKGLRSDRRELTDIKHELNQIMRDWDTPQTTRGGINPYSATAAVETNSATSINANQSNFHSAFQNYGQDDPKIVRKQPIVISKPFLPQSSTGTYSSHSTPPIYQKNSHNSLMTTNSLRSTFSRALPLVPQQPAQNPEITGAVSEQLNTSVIPRPLTAPNHPASAISNNFSAQRPPTSRPGTAPDANILNASFAPSAPLEPFVTTNSNNKFSISHKIPTSCAFAASKLLNTHLHTPREGLQVEEKIQNLWNSIMVDAQLP